MRNTAAETSARKVASFRLRRHHLAEGLTSGSSPKDEVTICRDVCGVQAQVTPAAYLQLWTRNHALNRAEIEDALWKKRTLIKTSLMRQTLHLIPTDEFWIYISALRRSRLAGALGVMARCGIEREEGEALTPLVLDALAAGPLGRGAIADMVRPKVSKRVRSWMEKVWSIVRMPVADGLICYGRGESSEVVFVRVDQWMPGMKAKPLSAQDAQCALLRKYLRAYGPATLRDFSHWAGISMQEVRPLRELVDSDVVELPEERKGVLLLREDLATLKKSSLKKVSIRLLPLFDPYLLAHHTKEHLLSAQHYKRVYRNQGWISPVVLIDGEIAGVWSHKIQQKKLRIKVEPFEKVSKIERQGIEREAEALAGFFGSGLELQFA